VHVIAHQDIRVNGKGVLSREQAQQTQVVVPVFVIDEDRAPIYTAVRDV
jgi:hypothetical protein